MLVRLVYVSYANNAMPDSEIKLILEKSQANNKKVKVGGVLIYSDRYFFQCLEGEREEINQTYLRIARDSRHSKCVVIAYSQINSRLFPTWSMAYVSFNGLGNELVFKYSEKGLFKPYEYTAGQATEFLTEVSEVSEMTDAPAMAA
jgi:hypothetical protein